jgi:MoaA/NifB/PqqE/SkfB family radical SAM enzyme
VALRRAVALVRNHSPGQILNVLRYRYHAWRGFPRVDLPYSPVWLTLFIASRCNLRCRQCPFHSPGSPRESHGFQDMTLDTFREILQRFPRAMGIHFTGGEPLLNALLFAMVHLAHERRMEVRISTNGTLLSRNMDAILSAPIDLLNVSFYGTDAQSFAQVTGARPALFDEMVGAISELVGRRPAGGLPRILRTSFICTKENLHSALDFVRFSERLGVDQVILFNLFYSGIQGFDESLCLYEDDPQVQRFIEHLGQQDFRIPVFLPKLYKREYQSVVCNMPFGLLTIDGDGFIGPCCFHGTGEHWGNLFEKPEVWNGPAMTEARRAMLDPNRSLPVTCMHCEHMISERPCVGGIG